MIVSARAAGLLRDIFGGLEIEEAMDWSVIRTPEARRLMEAERGGLTEAWARFSRAGSIVAARQLVNELPLDLRRLLIVFTVTFVRGRIEGDRDTFLVLDGATEIPPWFHRLIY